MQAVPTRLENNRFLWYDTPNTVPRYQVVNERNVKNMKVILLQDVAKIGRRAAVVEVPDGYALNQLIPKKMAEPATAANLKRVERMRATATASKEAGEARFDAAIAALKAQTLSIAASVNEQGHCFKAVSEADVVEAAKAAEVDIDTTMVSFAAPIKELGKHEVMLVSGARKEVFTIEVTKA